MHQCDDFFNIVGQDSVCLQCWHSASHKPIDGFCSFSELGWASAQVYALGGAEQFDGNDLFHVSEDFHGFSGGYWSHADEVFEVG